MQKEKTTIKKREKVGSLKYKENLPYNNQNNADVLNQSTILSNDW